MVTDQQLVEYQGTKSPGQPIPNLESTKLRDYEGDPRATREISEGGALGESVLPQLDPIGVDKSSSGKVDLELRTVAVSFGISGVQVLMQGGLKYPGGMFVVVWPAAGSLKLYYMAFVLLDD
ncbi:hypothetical protein U1Q18_012598 [Sarracenia purpurea var. burkii]